MNGFEGRKFVCRRDLRKGDPISSLLLVLVVDVFSRMLNEGMQLGLLEGLGKANYSFISLQFFLLLILLSLGIKIVGYLSEHTSGLNINFQKSMALRLGDFREIASMFNCKIGTFPVTYLGMPTRPGKLLKENWQPVIDRVEKKLTI